MATVHRDRTSTDRSACQDYIREFYPIHESKYCHRTYPHEVGRVQFMLEHREIRSKVDEWIEQGVPPEPSLLMNHSSNQATGVEPVDMITQMLDSAIGRSNPSKSTYAKDPQLALKKRQLGNTAFQQKRLTECLDHYNACLQYTSFEAPYKLPGVGICLANRSAVLVELGKYEEALTDIELATEKFRYPENLQHKVVFRKIHILIKMKRFSKAEDLISVSRKRFANSPDMIQKLEDLHTKLRIAQEFKYTDKGTGLANDTSQSDEPRLFSPNPRYKYASSTIMLKYSVPSGRYVVANEDLKLGDVIYEEPPYASVLLPKYYATHCYQCHRRVENYSFFPCRNCTQVKYCSELCSTESWNETHQYECLHLDFLASTGIAHLALRIVLIAGKQLIHKVMMVLAKEDEYLENLRKDTDLFFSRTREDEEAAHFRPTLRYQRVYSLLDHLIEMESVDTFQYALTAALLVHYLVKKTTFFDAPYENNEKLSSPETYIVGGAILHHIGQLICNANAVSSIESEISRSDAPLTELSQVRLASGIYPSASLMNHACSPNILSVFKNGRTLMTKIAVDSLPAGSEILNCYGPHFRRMSVNDRQESLMQQYFFKCQCPVCVEELASNRSFADKFSGFRCPNCDEGYLLPDCDNQCFVSKCFNCHKSTNLKNAMQKALKTDTMFSDGMELLNEGNIQAALSQFIVCYQERKEILYPYHSDLGNFSDCLAKYYAISDNYGSALRFARISLDYVKARFGATSIEWAQEFMKFVEIKEMANCAAFLLTNEDSQDDLDEINEQDGAEMAQKILKMYNQRLQ